MTWGELGTLATLSGVILTGIGLLGRGVKTLRDNHMAHLNDKLDTVLTEVRHVQKTADRTEEKVDDHIKWHLEKKG